MWLSSEAVTRSRCRRAAGWNRSVEVQDELYLGISLGGSGTIERRVSRERFGYV